MPSSLLGWLLFATAYFWLFRREWAQEWRDLFPRAPRLPPPAGGHWHLRRRK